MVTISEPPGFCIDTSNDSSIRNGRRLSSSSTRYPLYCVSSVLRLRFSQVPLSSLLLTLQIIIAACTLVISRIFSSRFFQYMTDKFESFQSQILRYIAIYPHLKYGCLSFMYDKHQIQNPKQLRHHH